MEEEAEVAVVIVVEGEVVVVEEGEVAEEERKQRKTNGFLLQSLVVW